jgi:hypothetical protein
MATPNASKKIKKTIFWWTNGNVRRHFKKPKMLIWAHYYWPSYISLIQIMTLLAFFFFFQINHWEKNLETSTARENINWLHLFFSFPCLFVSFHHSTFRHLIRHKTTHFRHLCHFHRLPLNNLKLALCLSLSILWNLLYFGD